MTEPLPETFSFSQRKFQDYVDCARRFQLRYVLMQPWPALITDSPRDQERLMARGAAFHHLVHQHRLGLEPELLEATIDDPDLLAWWQTYLRHPPADLPTAVQRAETVVAASLGGYRLLAKYDLVAAEPEERLVIVDWKTVAHPPGRETLARWLQTRLYRYLAVEAGGAFFGGRPPAPEQVGMIYWFASQGGQTQRFAYNAGQYAADREYLTGLVADIAARRGEIWPLTPDERQCRFCNYRSLCERGVKAGFLGDLQDDLEADEVEIDLEQVAEIEF